MPQKQMTKKSSLPPLLALLIFRHFAICADFPRVLTTPHQVYLAQGLPGRIECRVESNPPVSIVQWSKNGYLINDSYYSVTPQGSLVIGNVQVSDQGQYTCKPYSSLGHGHVSLPIKVVVKIPPYFTVQPKIIYQRHTNQSVTMPCIADGDPKASIIWRKIEGLFPAKTKTLHDGGNLTIVQLTKEDQGIYECVASNPVASVIASALLIIEVTSHHPPFNLSVHTTQNSARVCWLPAYDNGHPQHYVIWYTLDSSKDSSWLTIRVIPEDTSCFTIFELQPISVYLFIVQARNRLGEALSSNPVQATTKDLKTKVKSMVELDGNRQDDEDDDGEDEDLFDSFSGFNDNAKYNPSVSGNRPEPPQNISVRIQKDGLYIAWLPPRNNPHHVDYYVIQYRTVGPWTPLNDAPIRETMFHWKQSSFGAKYQFKVLAFNALNVSSESSPVAMIFTGDPQATSSKMSSGLLFGLVGGLIVAFASIIFIILLIRLCRYKRLNTPPIRYDSVMCFSSTNNLAPSANRKKKKVPTETLR